MSDTSALRRDARKIFLAAVHAADPSPLVHAALLNAPELHHGELAIVVAAGKAAPGMAAAAMETLGDRVHRCVVVTPLHDGNTSHASDTPNTRVIHAGHPLPDETSVTAARTVLELVANADAAHVLIVLLSGGASALLAAPPHGISLDDYRDTTSLLLAAGASIDDVNCVRKHIDDIKGGRLAIAAAATRIVCLVVSDVVDNRLDVIASGPLVADPTTRADALDVLQRFNLQSRVPAPVLEHLRARAQTDSTAAREPAGLVFERVRHQILAHNGTALDAAMSFARRLGYDTVRIGEAITGDAVQAGQRLGGILADTHAQERRSAVIAGGETTVIVAGSGTGGRNQELALAAALKIDGVADCVLLSAGTDGVDGVTDAAGAIVDGGTVHRILASGIDPADALSRNDSHAALDAAADLLVTGPTGTNVMDIHILLTGLRAP